MKKKRKKPLLSTRSGAEGHFVKKKKKLSPESAACLPFSFLSRFLFLLCFFFFFQPIPFALVNDNELGLLEELELLV